LAVLKRNVQSLTEQIVMIQKQMARLVDGLTGSETGIGAVFGHFLNKETI
jgi:hypothetical protein